MRRALTALILVLASATALAAPRSLDRAHSEIRFSVKQMGVTVDGHFERFTARIDLDAAQPERSQAEIQVDIASLTTGDPDADAVAVDTPWLDRAGFPQARFKSRTLRALGGGRYEARGPLTLKGRTREIVVPFSLQDQPDRSTQLSGEFTLKRSDFGIGGGDWNEGGLVAEEVPVRFRLRLAPASH